MRKVFKKALAFALAGAMVVQPIPGTVGQTTVDAAGIADEFEIPSANADGRVGALMPYTRYDSEEATLGGSAALAVSTDWDDYNIATQASKQSYVRLPGSGAYAEWTMKTTGAGVTMRFTMPDSSDGMGLDGSVDVYVNGSKVKTVDLTSYYMWQYGNHQDAPNDDAPQFAFDEVHFKLDQPLKVGDKIRIQSSGASGLEYGVDFIETENVPDPIEQPDNSVSVEDYGAVADDGVDDLAAFEAAVSDADANGMDVYVPEGTYHLGGIWAIGCSDMKITGAGIWYTNIQFTSDKQFGGGISGGNSSYVTDGYCDNLEFCHMYLNSNLRSRYGENAVYKCFMDIYDGGSVIHDIWEEHFECGFWFGDYNGSMDYSDGVKVVNSRIRNNLADGVNFCMGTSNAVVYNCDVRNNGDDGLAMWNNSSGAKDESNNVFAYNTIEFGWRAGLIAIYGGNGHKVYNNYLSDAYKASGIHLNTTFSGYRFDNNTGITFDNNILVRCGTNSDLYGEDLAAIDIKQAVKNVTFNNTQIYDSPADAIRLLGNEYSGIVFNDTKIYGAGLSGVEHSYSNSFAHTGAAIRESGSSTAVFNGLEIANVAKFPNSNITTWPYYTDNATPQNLANNDTVTILEDDVAYEIPSLPDPDESSQGGGVVDVLEGITGYDVEVAALAWANESGSTTIKEGDKVSFTAVIRNTTNVDIPEGVSIGVKITIDGKGSYTNTSYKGGLKAGATVKLTPTAKWTATAGGHTIVATADHQDKLYAEITNDNNTRTKSFNVEEVQSITTYTPVTGGYDLVITDISYGKDTIAVGDTLTWTATVVNAGDTAVPSGETIGIQFQVDGNTGNITWCDSYNGGLAPGASVQLTCNGGTSGNTWTASTAGTYEIMGWVDDVNRFASEVNENNNKKTISITVPYGGVQYIESPDYPDDVDNLGEVVTPVPTTAAPTTVAPTTVVTPETEPATTTAAVVDGQCDLVVTDIYTDKTYYAGEEAQFVVKVKNQGTGATPSDIKHGLLLYVNGTAVNWCDTHFDSMQPGEEVELVMNYGPNNKSTWTVTAGTYTVQAWIDDQSLITESNENNNRLEKSMTFTTEPVVTTTAQTETPAEVTGLSVTSSSYNTISVVWSSNADKEAKGQVYNVYVDGVKKLSNVVVSTYAFDSIDAGSHTVKVTAVLNGTETAGATATVSVSDEPVVSTNVNVEINGYQISTTVEGFRTVYSINDPNNEVVSAGMLYGIGDVAESSMVYGATGVYNFGATDAGKLDATFSSYADAQSYSMTMKFSKTASFYTTEMNVRAYAKLADGTYVYSNVETFTVYYIADYLYQNLQMNNLEGHDYLYENILKVVDSSYVEKDFAWNNSIVKPGDVGK